MRKGANIMKEKIVIKKLKEEILRLGDMHPGSISKQYTVCGKKGCKCQNEKNPQKHGPYYQLSYSIKGKSSSIFIKKENLVKARKLISNYKRFKELCVMLTKAYVEYFKVKGFSSDEK